MECAQVTQSARFRSASASWRIAIVSPGAECPRHTPDRFVILGGVRFHYLDRGGDGVPMLLLAGLGCTPHVFAELAPHLTNRFRVLALSRRGHGLTDQVRSGYSLADAAEDARGLLDALGIERAHLVGHSMGGGEVSALAVRHPERVASVVYLDGAYDWADRLASEEAAEDEPAWAESPDRFASYDDFAEFVRSMDPAFETIWGPAVDAMCRAAVDIHPDGSVTEKLSDSEAAPFVEALQEFRHPYAEIAAPALAIYALGDQWQGAQATWRAACRDRFAAETPDARVVELRASHYLFIDHRDEVLAAMRQFLT
jgi:pimeloyl-ACP methyl ester carboxylesterase